jgi:single-strand DNA-binding protein
VAGSVNVVVLVGNLTRDPELRALPSGNSVCSLRIAVTDQVKDQATGEWTDKPNYFSVDVFGRQAETCAQYLARGRQVAIQGRLRWREWETQDGQKREAVSVAADRVQFIGPREGGGAGAYNAPPQRGQGAPFNKEGLEEPASGDFAEDDDIPF